MGSISFAEETTVQPRKLIDLHTAGLLPRANFDLELSMYPNGDPDRSGSGLSAMICVGIANRLSVGVGYGGDGIIGRERPQFNPHIGAMIKYRIIEENYFLPAIALGYDHQGTGGIDGDYNGYVFKSPGFFLAASKNYLLFSSVQLGLHGGINYSFEEYKDIHWPNGYAGLDLGFNEELSLITEYDLALNSNHDTNPLHGYLNLGVRWAFSPSLFIEFDAKDILQNKVRMIDGEPQTMGWCRQLKLVYLVDFLKD